MMLVKPTVANEGNDLGIATNHRLFVNSTKATPHTFDVVLPTFINELKTHIARLKIPPIAMPSAEYNLPASGIGPYVSVVAPDREYAPLEMWFTCDQDMRAYSILAGWQQALIDPTTAHVNDVKTTIQVHKFANTLNDSAKATGVWVFGNCFPEYTDIGEFNFQSDGQATVGIYVRFKHDVMVYVDEKVATQMNHYRRQAGIPDISGEIIV